jgi:hypothetical protein
MSKLRKVADALMDVSSFTGIRLSTGHLGRLLPVLLPQLWCHSGLRYDHLS